MVGPLRNLTFSAVSLDDVDQFSEWARGLGWDVEQTQLTRGTNLISYDHFEFADLILGHLHYKQSMHNAFVIPDGMVVLVIPRAKLSLTWSGARLQPSLVGLVQSGRSHYAVHPAEWDSYEFMISEELIRRTEMFPHGYLSEMNRLKHPCLPLVEPQTESFIKKMDFFFSKARKESTSLDATLCGIEIYEGIIHGLQQLIDAGLDASGWHSPQATRRADLVPKAWEFMAANLTSNLTSDEIAQSLGVSYRVLNYAFQDALGVSPYRYFLTQRLHAVRRQLKTDKLSITEASVSHGFHTPSRFARQYKRLFGELPSETRYRRR